MQNDAVNQHPDNPGLRDWRTSIQHALEAINPDDLQLYAGDDRRRLAQQHQAREGRARRAGVLIPIVAAEQPRIVLTERSHSLRSHPGQISFPGGSVEPDDIDVEAAALRESHEEVGLDPGQVQVLGRLPDYVTGTGFNIAPIVGWIVEDAHFSSNDDEVARLFTIPLEYALEAAHYRLKAMTINDSNYKFHVIEYMDNFIWGATAAMLFGLRECMARSSATDASDSATAY